MLGRVRPCGQDHPDVRRAKEGRAAEVHDHVKPSLEQRMDLSCELRRRELVVLSLQLDDPDVGLAVIDEQVVLAHRRPARDSRDRGPQCIPSSLFQPRFIVIDL